MAFAVNPLAAQAQTVTQVQPAPFDDLFVFGDSLSDTGNVFEGTGGTIPSAPPYAPGRFSNGPVWVDQLVDDLAPVLVEPSSPSRNYAFGGARTDASFDPDSGIPPGILSQLQIQRFNFRVTDTAFNTNDLVVLWAGANNIFDASSFIRRNAQAFPDEASARSFLLGESAAAAADMDLAIKTIVANGARTLLVPNLPDLGKVPRFRNEPDRAVLATLASQHFNDLLATSLDTIRHSSGEDLKIVSMDIKTLFELVRSRPREFGITNVSDPCINQVSEVDPATLSMCSTDYAEQNRFLFWDDIHPTAATHELIAKTAIGLLTADRALETPMMFSEASLITARALSQDVWQHLTQLRLVTQNEDRSPQGHDNHRSGQPVSMFLLSSNAFGRRFASGIAPASNYNLQAWTGGLNVRLGEQFMAGVAVSRIDSDYSVIENGHFDASGWQALLFANFVAHGFSVDAMIANGSLDFEDYSRTTMLAPIRARGKSEGTYWNAAANAGYGFRAGAITYSVSAGLRHIFANVRGFDERQAPILGLEIGRQKLTSVTALQALSVSGQWDFGQFQIVPHVRLTYENELHNRRTGSARLAGNTANALHIGDNFLGQDGVLFNGGLMLNGRTFQFSADYTQRSTGSRGAKDQQVLGRLSFAF